MPSTPHLHLHPITLSDAQGLFELDSDPEVHRYLGNKPVQEISEVHDIIKFIQQQYAENGIGRWAVVEKDTNEFVGWAGLKLVKEVVNNHSNYYDLGYRLLRKHWGKGYATECAVASLKHGFETMQLDTIYAAAHVDNAASNKILKKMGFQLTETFQFHGSDCNWYKLSREEWKQIKELGGTV